MAAAAGRLIPDLPDDVALSCLARVPRGVYGSLKLVCRSWRAAIEGSELYTQRSQLGATESWLHLIPLRSANWFAFSPVLSRWFALPWQGPRFIRCVEVLGRYLLAFGTDDDTGGSYPFCHVNKVSVFDSVTSQWSDGPPFPRQLKLSDAIGAHGKVVLFSSVIGQCLYMGVSSRPGEVVAMRLSEDREGGEGGKSGEQRRSGGEGGENAGDGGDGEKGGSRLGRKAEVSGLQEKGSSGAMESHGEEEVWWEAREAWGEDEEGVGEEQGEERKERKGEARRQERKKATKWKWEELPTPSCPGCSPHLSFALNGAWHIYSGALLPTLEPSILSFHPSSLSWTQPSSLKQIYNSGKTSDIVTSLGLGIPGWRADLAKKIITLWRASGVLRHLAVLDDGLVVSTGGGRLAGGGEGDLRAWVEEEKAWRKLSDLPFDGRSARLRVLISI
ncbi:hypothetical protein CLOM_g17182 [Closterium sp. NIES-68]|nr:hypothetical protein CLOM_g17182 [Closterium sp. NIES-68]GJP63203.1 hypothetical protein CLOP_g20267 [Closterium sp. NIES-67]